ncbi:Poly(U)-binding-splicing factor puf60 [Sparganum proliferum]
MSEQSVLLSTLSPGDVIIAAHGPVYNGPGAQKPDSPFVLRKLEKHQKEAIDRAKGYALEQSIKTALLKQTQSQQNLQTNAAKRTQTLTLLNRIYIGSIAYDIKEEMIKQAFLPFGPVKSVSMSWDPATQKHKGFAFVEYEYPEAAQLAIDQMNGTNFGGRLLKVGRPSNLPNADTFINDLVEEFQLHRRIYVAGVHLDLTEPDLSLVFEAFGKITMCKLVPDPLHPPLHRGFGYIEFETVQSANDAALSMNKFDLGGQLLRVCKAISPPDGVCTNTASQLPPAAAVAAASVTAKLLSMDAQQLPSSQPPLSPTEDIRFLPNSLSKPTVTTITNIISLPQVSQRSSPPPVATRPPVETVPPPSAKKTVSSFQPLEMVEDLISTGVESGTRLKLSLRDQTKRQPKTPTEAPPPETQPRSQWAEDMSALQKGEMVGQLVLAPIRPGSGPSSRQPLLLDPDLNQLCK